MNPVAQTNLQLVDQLHNLKFNDSDIRRIFEYCTFMSEFAGGTNRATERPLYCHLIGVGSLVADDFADVTMISGAILHAVYEYGRFPRWINKTSMPAMRKIVREHTNAEIEELVYAYHTQKDRVFQVPLDKMDAFQKKILVIRLADTLEEFIEINSGISSRKKAGIHDLRNEKVKEEFVKLTERVNATQLSKRYTEILSVPYEEFIVTEKQGSYYRPNWLFSALR